MSCNFIGGKSFVEPARTQLHRTQRGINRIVNVSQTFKTPNTMSQLDPSVFCPEVQTHMDEMFAEGNPELLQEDNGAILAVTSPENLNGVRITPLMEDGQITNQVKVIVTQRPLSSNVRDTVSDCFPDNMREPQPTAPNTYEIDDAVEDTWLMDKQAWRNICRGKNPGRQFSLYMAQCLNILVERMNEKLNASIAANFGNYYGGTSSSSSPAALDLLQGTPLALNPSGYYDMVNAMADIGAPRFMIIGSGEIRKALQFQDIGCCNTGGADLSQLEPGMFYQDRNARTTFTGERFACLQPGSVVIPNFAENVGEYEFVNSLHSKIVLQHPRTGLLFDVDVKFDADCNQIKVWARKKYTTVYTRTGAFASGDLMFGVNGVVQFNAAT